jgi:phospholipid-binding lipoprotein MlaA
MYLRLLTLASSGRYFAISFCLALSALAGTGTAEAQQTPAAEAENFNDPYEDTNRAIFDFNLEVDRIVLVPVAKTYREILPTPVRTGIHNFLQNLNEPLVFANDVLQGRPDLATNTFARFLTNSTLGIGGILDIATQAQLPHHDNDLGITFAVWGMGDGPYLMLPVLGPANLRDAIGEGIEAYGDPGNIVAGDHGYTWAAFARAGTSGIDRRSRNIETLAEIEKTSLDYYATIRSLYRQRRAAEIRHEKSTLPSIGVTGGGDESDTAPISYTVQPPPAPSQAPKK